MNDRNPSPTPLPADFEVHADDCTIGVEDDDLSAPKKSTEKKYKEELQLQRASQSYIDSLMSTAICIRANLSFTTGLLAQAALSP